jgi:hypothetical protein
MLNPKDTPYNSDLKKLKLKNSKPQVLIPNL